MLTAPSQGRRLRLAISVAKGVTVKRWLSIVVALLIGMFLVGDLATADAAPTAPPKLAPRTSNSGPPASAIPTLESTYVPIRPCRIADTRASSAGQLRRNSTRPFYVRGSSGFAGQGGTSAGCGVPASATGVTVNTTVTNVTGTGFMTNYPTGSSRPLSNFIFLNKSVTQTSNPTFALAPGGAEPAVQIYTSAHADADLIIDVTGYYQPAIHALVNPSGAIYSGSPRVLSVSKVSTGYFAVTIDSNVNFCSAHASTYYADEYANATTISGSTVYVHVWYLSSTTHVETPVDDYFYLTVSC